MSGIAAIIHFDGRPVDAGHIDAMTASMPYRGVDGVRHWIDGPVALGQCMMHTTAESREAELPLASDAGGTVLIFHGRIDNRDELRSYLVQQGVRPRSGADAELVLQGFLRHGEEILPRLEGDFAGLIWDAGARRVLCFRDIMGHKPLCYAWSGRTLSVASDISALHALPWIQATIDEATIAEFIGFEHHSRTATLWCGLSRLPPSHAMICDAAGPVCREYWQPDLEADLPVRTESDLAAYYGDLLEDAVRRSSRAHLPVSCEASGGLDSSAIFAVARRLEEEGRLPAPGLHGVTFRFENDRNANDLPYARALARHLGVEIEEVEPARRPLAWYAARAAAWHDIPGLPNGVSHLSTARAARANEGRVLLVGVGGDEWLSGTYEYADAIAGFHLGGLRESLAADRAAFGLSDAAWRLFRLGLVPNAPAPLLSALRGLRDRRAGNNWGQTWLRPRLRDLLEERRQDGLNSRRPCRTHSQRRLEVLRLSAYNQFAKETMERQAAIEGVEHRYPYEDRRIIELAYAVPAWMARRGAYRKYYHRQAMQGLLPEELRWRCDKAIFNGLFDEVSLEILRQIEAGGFPDLTQWVDKERLPDWRCIAQDRGRTTGYNMRIWALAACAMAAASGQAQARIPCA